MLTTGDVRAEGLLFFNFFLWHARRVAQDLKDCAHRKAMREQKDFYGWMTGRIASFKPKLVAHGYFRNKHKRESAENGSLH